VAVETVKMAIAAMAMSIRKFVFIKPQSSCLFSLFDQLGTDATRFLAPAARPWFVWHPPGIT